MTFAQYWAILTKRWHIVLLCFFIVGIGTFAGSKLMKPVYQSSTLIQVAIRSASSNPADYNNLQASDQLVQTEADLAVNTSVLSAVVPHFPGMTVGQLAAEVSSTTKLNTQLFEIDVLDHSPDRAASLANAIATALIQQQQTLIDQENTQAQQQIKQNIDTFSQQIDATTTQISALQTSEGTTGSNQGQIALLQVRLNALQQQYNQWQSALTQLDLSQAQSGNPLLVVQTAQPSTAPVKPNVPLYTAGGFFMGLLLGALLVLVQELVDTRVRTPDKIIQLLGWPVLASTFRTASSKPQDVINLDKQNFNIEPLRLLRTNIGFSGLDRPLRSMIVTSAQKGDGKSVIAANLAILMARAGKSTLLIDADLRSPSQQTLFNLPPNKLGLSNAVLSLNGPDVSQPPSYHQFMVKNSTTDAGIGAATNGFSLRQYIYTVNIPNLWIMPSGPLPPNPSEFLESKIMQRFLTAIENCGVEIVIFDVPPLLGLSDASILASKVDGALVVVDATRATKDKLKQTKAALLQTGVQVLGCVANKVPHKGNETYYYYAEDQAGVEKKNGYASTPAGFPGAVEHSYEHNVHSN